MKNWLKRRNVVEMSNFHSEGILNEAPQGSLLWLVLFNISLSDLVKRMNRKIKAFSGGKLSA